MESEGEGGEEEGKVRWEVEEMWTDLGEEERGCNEEEEEYDDGGLEGGEAMDGGPASEERIGGCRRSN